MLGGQTSATITIHDNDNFMRIVEGAASTPITAAKTIEEGGTPRPSGVIENAAADGSPYNSLRFVLEMDVAPGRCSRPQLCGHHRRGSARHPA